MVLCRELETLLVLLLAVIWVSDKAKSQEFDPELRIVGGVRAYHGEFPSIVRILKRGKHHCAGTILSPRTVFSAAHCFEPEPLPYIYTVVAGDHWVDYVDGTEQLRRISRIKFDGYNPATIQHDRVHLYLDRSFEFNSYVQDTDYGWVAGTGDTATVAGWGGLWDGGPLSSVLLKTDVKIVSRETCRAAYYDFYQITSDMFCAAAPGKDACQGDSGGPIYYEDVLLGCVSFGLGCADPGFPGIYQKVR